MSSGPTKAPKQVSISKTKGFFTINSGCFLKIASKLFLNKQKALCFEPKKCWSFSFLVGGELQINLWSLLIPIYITNTTTNKRLHLFQDLVDFGPQAVSSWGCYVHSVFASLQPGYLISRLARLRSPQPRSFISLLKDPLNKSDFQPRGQNALKTIE